MNSSKKIKHYIENIEGSCQRRLLGLHSVTFDSIFTEKDADDTCFFLPRGEFNKSLDRVDIYDSKKKNNHLATRIFISIDILQDIYKELYTNYNLLDFFNEDVKLDMHNIISHWHHQKKFLRGKSSASGFYSEYGTGSSFGRQTRSFSYDVNNKKKSSFLPYDKGTPPQKEILKRTERFIYAINYLISKKYLDINLTLYPLSTGNVSYDAMRKSVEYPNMFKYQKETNSKTFDCHQCAFRLSGKFLLVLYIL